MKVTVTLLLTVLACVAALLFQGACARPYDSSALSDQDRQEILHLAARIVRVALKPESVGEMAAAKRNSGMLDAVMNMPDLFKAGR